MAAKVVAGFARNQTPARFALRARRLSREVVVPWCLSRGIPETGCLEEYGRTSKTAA